MSTISTNLFNASAGLKHGAITDGGYSALVNAAKVNINMFTATPGFGLKSEMGNLAAAVEASPGIKPGTEFDPDARAVGLAIEKISLRCAANNSPMFVMSVYE